MLWPMFYQIHVTQDCSLLFYGVSFIGHSHNLLVKELRSARAAVEYAAKPANHQGHMWDACHTMARPFQQLNASGLSYRRSVCTPL